MPNYNKSLLKVDGIDFSIPPSDIKPSVEILKTSERSISGKLCVDYIGEKINLDITWGILTATELEKVKKTFVKGDATIKISYLNESEENVENPTAQEYYFDAISYTPIFVQDSLKWQNVTVKLLQL